MMKMTSDELVLEIVNLIDDYRIRIKELEEENKLLTEVAEAYGLEYGYSLDEILDGKWNE